MHPHSFATRLAWISACVGLGSSACSTGTPQDAATGSAAAGTTSGATAGMGAAKPPAAAAGSGGPIATGAPAIMQAPKAGNAATAAAGSGASLPAQAQAGRAGSAPSASSAAGTSGSITAAGSGAAAGSGGSNSVDTSSLEKFSFFVTSLAGLQRLSKSDNGFGGDLRFGQADGLSGADKICSELAEASMPGAAAKGWRAFLSVAAGPDGKPVNAIDRVGAGPWYDRLGRVLAMNKMALLSARPQGADPAIVDDLPNEDGVPNMQPDPNKEPVNNHHVLTGSDAMGKLYMNSVNSTCNNWTSTEKSAGRPRIGFSYPAGNRQNWLSGQDEGGCGAGKVLVDMGGSNPNNPVVGSGGGYGGFYCFALKP